MNPHEQLGPCRALSEWLGALGYFPGDGWLYVRDDVASISGDTPCWPLVTEGRDFSEEDQDAFERWASSNGYKCFLCEDQLVDIRENLRQQTGSFDMRQLVNAVAHYWSHDSFIRA